MICCFLNFEDEVTSLIGSKEAIINFSLCVINPGDYALVTDPGYPVYEIGTMLAGGESYKLPLTDKSKGKQKLITSTKLELYRSPQNFVNDFIIGKIGGFNLQNKYGNPTNFYSQSYNELTELREEFFDCYEVTTDTNKFIRSHESMFNHSLGEGIKQVAPARSTFSDKNSNFGVEIKPTILEKQKYEHEKHSVEVNPNTITGSINPVVSSLTSEYIRPKSGSVSINITNTTTYEQPKTQHHPINSD